MRDGLVTYVRRDLQGPWDGGTEVLSNASSGPRDRYLVGMLGPQSQSVTGEKIALAAARSADGDSGDEQEGDEGELQERLTPQAAGHIWASSMGLSFTVPASVDTLSAQVRWAPTPSPRKPGIAVRLAGCGRASALRAWNEVQVRTVWRAPRRRRYRYGRLREC
ncbi:hypothetical protein ACFVU0_33140 [Streptomyces sp. NPDC058122]|uniref:hypothetical protein n=1 Tax=Streptomyces sp. NPDC058122 TaxID=3346349 RepID=UPI0036E14705